MPSGFRANAAARGMPDPAKFAALSAGQAAAVAHVAAHDLGAAAYAIRAASACVPAGDAARARAREREWQRAHLPAAIRELVLDDQQRRSAICWHVFARNRRYGTVPTAAQIAVGSRGLAAQIPVI